MSKYLLKLYITGETIRSKQAIANLNKICQDELPDQYDLKIIDVLQEPEIAEKHKILVTPTLIRERPLPIQRMIGDMSDLKSVLLGLNILS